MAGGSFDSFVVDDGSRLAYEAATTVAARPGAQINPLIVCGGHGHGKTHLLQAVATDLAARGGSPWQLTGRAWSDRLVDAVRQGRAGKFVADHERRTAVLMDDIAPLATSAFALSEFTSAVRRMVRSGVQVVLASDRPAPALTPLHKELTPHCPDLVLACLWGPTLETRARVLEREFPQLPRRLLHQVAERRGGIPAARAVARALRLEAEVGDATTVRWRPALDRHIAPQTTGPTTPETVLWTILDGLRRTGVAVDEPGPLAERVRRVCGWLLCEVARCPGSTVGRLVGPLEDSPVTPPPVTPPPATTGAPACPRATFTPTGSPELDRLLGGGLRGEAATVVTGPDEAVSLEVVTRLALDVAVRQGEPVLFCSLRVPARTLALHLVAALAGIDPERLTAADLEREQWTRLAAASWRLQEAPLYVEDFAGAHRADLHAAVRRRRGTARWGLVIVDGSDLVDPYADHPPHFGAVAAGTGTPVVVTVPDQNVGPLDDEVASVLFTRPESGGTTSLQVASDSRADGALPIALLRQASHQRDGTGAAVGWRLWRPDPVPRPSGDELVLFSPLRGDEWPRGVKEAACPHCPDGPQPTCSCGIYSYAAFREAFNEWLNRPSCVLGQVRCWGRVLRHTGGWRAQFAQPVLVMAPDDQGGTIDEVVHRYECDTLPFRSIDLTTWRIDEHRPF